MAKIISWLQNLRKDILVVEMQLPLIKAPISVRNVMATPRKTPPPPPPRGGGTLPAAQGNHD